MPHRSILLGPLVHPTTEATPTRRYVSPLALSLNLRCHASTCRSRIQRRSVETVSISLEAEPTPPRSTPTEEPRTPGDPPALQLFRRVRHSPQDDHAPWRSLRQFA